MSSGPPVAFAVDPLYYQTSAKLDEGGAKGLLLCNLGVFGGCRVLFDSQEVPAKCISPTNGSTSSDLVDVSFAKESIELMAANLYQKQDISPSLRVLKRQFDEFALPSRTFDSTDPTVIGNIIDTDNVEFNVGKEFLGNSDATVDFGFQINDGSYDYTEASFADCYYDTTVSDEGVCTGNPVMQNYNECLGRTRRRFKGPDLQGDNVDGSFSSWDNESTADGPVDDFVHRNAEEDIYISVPRRVDNIEVEYDKTLKQVDVHVLKETLWNLVQRSIQTPELMQADAVSFRHVLNIFPDDCKAAATHDISPHLCFICLLHLANEHGLTIVGCPNLDDFSIHFPVACEESGEVIQASS